MIYLNLVLLLPSTEFCEWPQIDVYIPQCNNQVIVSDDFKF